LKLKREKLNKKKEENLKGGGIKMNLKNMMLMCKRKLSFFGRIFEGVILIGF